MLERQTVLAGRYRVLGVIGRGGMGVVYRAYDERERRLVAVKTVRRDDRELVVRLRREADLLGQLHHPNVVRLLDVGEVDGLPFIVTQLVDGTPLRDLLGRMTSRRTAWVGEQVASALTAAHALEIVHRDLKPSNVLVGADIVRLLDFGIARHADDTTMTSGEALIGTVSYLAPEQISDGAAGPPSDIYALGLVLVECFTGKPAFPGTIAESVAARLADGPRIPAAVPESWRPLLEAMSQSAPGFRPTAAEVVTILRRLGRSPVAGAPALALAGNRGANPLLVLAGAGAGAAARGAADDGERGTSRHGRAGAAAGWPLATWSGRRRALTVPAAAAIGFVMAVTAANAFTVDRRAPVESAATTELPGPTVPEPTVPPSSIPRPRASSPTPAMPLNEAPVVEAPVVEAPAAPDSGTEVAEAAPAAAPAPPPALPVLLIAPGGIDPAQALAEALSAMTAAAAAPPVPSAAPRRATPAVAADVPDLVALPASGSRSRAAQREARLQEAREREARRQAERQQEAREREARRQAWEAARAEFRRDIRQSYRRRR